MIQFTSSTKRSKGKRHTLHKAYFARMHPSLAFLLHTASHLGKRHPTLAEIKQVDVVDLGPSLVSTDCLDARHLVEVASAGGVFFGGGSSQFLVQFASYGSIVSSFAIGSHVQTEQGQLYPSSP